MAAHDPTPPKIRLCISGSRLYGPLSKVREFVAAAKAKHPTLELVLGGANGVDTEAAKAAADIGCKVVVVYPDWDGYGLSAGTRRNERMVAMSDQLVAFWDEFSRGTAHAITAAHKAKILRAVYGAKGHELDLQDAVSRAFAVRRAKPPEKTHARRPFIS